MSGAGHRPIRLGSVHVACPDPDEKLGLPIAERLVEYLADGGDMALERILKLLSGIPTAWTLKISMVLFLYWPVSIVRIKGIP